MRYRYGDRAKVVPSDNKESNKAAVIVETRDNFWLPMVLRNFVRVLSGWNFYFIGPRNLINKVNAVVGGHWNYINMNFPSEVDSNRLSIPAYNRLLLGGYTLDSGKILWEHIKEEHIMIFQTDCICFRQPSEEQLSWDYIGAGCGKDRDEKTFVMNGGLSLRKRSAMMKVCSELSEDQKSGETNEDVVFTDHLRSQGYNIPELSHCLKFSVETHGDAGTAVGLHGTEKYWINDEDMHNIMNYARERIRL